MFIFKMLKLEAHIVEMLNGNLGSFFSGKLGGGGCGVAWAGAAWRPTAKQALCGRWWRSGGSGRRKGWGEREREEVRVYGGFKSCCCSHEFQTMKGAEAKFLPEDT